MVTPIIDIVEWQFRELTEAIFEAGPNREKQTQAFLTFVIMNFPFDLGDYADNSGILPEHNCNLLGIQGQATYAQAAREIGRRLALEIKVSF